jgi:prepilin-type N-terminal cleavage/methylation domain-containing protein
MSRSGRAVRGVATGRRRGFTLVEAVAAMAVLGALGSVSSGVIMSAVGSYRDAAVTAQLHEEVSSAMEVVTRQLRVIPQAVSGGADISAVTPTSIAYGTSSLTLSGTDLVWVNAGGAPVTLLSDVSGFALACFDGTNTAMNASLTGAECATVRRVSVTITLARDGRSDSVRSKVFLRGFVQGSMP